MRQPLIWVVLLLQSWAWGADKKPRPVLPAAPVPPPTSTVGTVTASPATIGFQASDPDLVAVAGSAPATITWNVTGGSSGRNWTLTVQADAASFLGCGQLPVSAATVACSSASVSGGGGSGTCSAAFPLSAGPQQVAGGLQGNGNRTYTVTINFSLADSWRYVAAPSCALTLTYIVTAP